MGGTFDPIHNGHMLVARAALRLGLDRVELVPARQPPHKTRRDISDPYQRYAMAALASVGEPRIGVSSIEVVREGPSFSIDTARWFTKPGTELFLIMGSDSLAEIDTWRECRSLLELARVLVYPRRPFASQPFDQFVGTLPEWVLRKREQGAIITLEGPTDDISSTELRDMVRQGRPVADHLPQAVAEFISKNGLYANEARGWEADAD